jgi:multicomponent Na+:H+ antiporter subunit D
MSNVLLALPILIPLTTALLALALWVRPAMQRVVSVVGAAALLGVGLLLLNQVWREGVLATQIANWPAPFGISLVADLTSAVMVGVTGLMGLVVALYSLAGIDRRREAFGYHALVHFLLMGVAGAFLTGDLFNLYVWFEIMLISSFVLIALGGTPEQIQGAVKYVTLSLLASMLFLAATGVIYGVTGALNMAMLHIYLAQATIPPGILLVLAMLFTLAFGIKAAIFPLFFWLPASYHTGPVVISALFAGLLTKVGVYALVRVHTLLFAGAMGEVAPILLVLAALTMVIGVLGAVAQGEMRRLLSFHIISQIGYMIMGLALFTPLALAGVLYFLVHNILAKTNLFLIGGYLAKLRGTEQLARLGGFYRTHPALSIYFLVAALALAGVPPLSGFWAKLMLVQAGLETESYSVVAVALTVSVLTLYSMTKIWAEAFWKEVPVASATAAKAANSTNPIMATRPLSRWAQVSLLAPIVLLTLLIVGMGLAVEPLVLLANGAAAQLLDPTEYVSAVLGAAAAAQVR